MHWILQNNLFHEKGMEELVGILEKFNLPFSIHKVIPFSGELLPDVCPSGTIMVMGSYSIVNIAKKRGWHPGVMINENFNYEIQVQHWHNFMLNADCVVAPFLELTRPPFEPFFMRPVNDAKYFAGFLTTWDDTVKWQNRIRNLEDIGSSLTGDTLIMVSEPKDIQREYRLWVVGRKVVTSSLYKIGQRVQYDSNVEDDVIIFGNERAKEWSPHECYVMDVALTEDGLKIIEVNNLNSAGLYAANVQKLVEALENFYE